MLINVGRDASVLARIELVEAIEFQDEVAFGDLQPGDKATGVGDLVDIDVDRPLNRMNGGSIVAHVIPSHGVVQATYHVDPACGEDKTTVVQVVLLRSVQGDVRPGLLAWRHLLAGGACR